MKNNNMFQAKIRLKSACLVLAAFSLVNSASAEDLFLANVGVEKQTKAFIETDENPSYVPGEYIVTLKEGVEPSAMLLSQGAQARSSRQLSSAITSSDIEFDPIVSKQSILKKAKKTLVQSRIRSASAPTDEQLLQDAYRKMNGFGKKLYRTYRLKNYQGDLKQLKSHTDIESVEPNIIYSTFYQPQDPYYAQQWAHQNTSIEQAWDINPGSSDVVVAVIDTGVDYAHEDLQNNIWRDLTGAPGKDFVNINTAAYVSQGYELIADEDYSLEDDDPSDVNGHGTHVSGIIAAANNNVGVVGVNPNAKIMPLRAGFALMRGGREYGLLDSAAIIKAINYAVDNGADVINMSFGSSQFSSATELALNNAYAQGVTLVGGVGNSSVDSVFYPAGYDNVIAVSSIDSASKRSWFSNHGDWVDIAAPGSSILSTIPFAKSDAATPGYAVLSGTSMASPYVAGVASLILSHNANATPEKVKYILTSATNQPNSGTDKIIGSGVTNVAQALLISLNAQLPSAVITSPGFNALLMDDVIDVFGTIGGNYTLEIADSPYATQWTLLQSGVNPANNLVGQITPNSNIERGNVKYLRLTDTVSGVTHSDLLQLRLFDKSPGWPQNTFAQQLASPNAYDLDNDGVKEVIVSVTTDVDDSTLLVFNHDGSLRWYKKIATRLIGSPAIADIDLDGVAEIAVSGWGGVHVFNADGSNQEGNWPKLFYTHRDPVMTDLDNDGDMEIVIPTADGPLPNFKKLTKVQAFHHDGTSLTGWPIAASNAATVASADFDGDGFKEVAFGTYGETSGAYGTETTLFYLVKYTGESFSPAWPKSITGWVEAPPAIGDMDLDGKLEIATVTASHVYALNPDGSDLSASWPIAMNINYWTVHQPPVLADIDRDNDLELLFTSGLANGIKKPLIHFYHHDATPVHGWPVSATNISDYGYNSIHPVVADIDSDNEVDVIIRTQQNILVYSPQGVAKTALGQFQSNDLGISGSSPFPIVGDLNGDNQIELLVVSNSDTINLYQYGLYNENSVEWSMFQGDSANSGVNLKEVGPIGQQTLSGTHFGLNRVLWDGSATQQGGVTRVGGHFRREQANAYDYETLVKFDVSGLAGTVVDATLRFHMVGGQVGVTEQVTLYNQDKADWLPATLNYDLFCISTENCPSWQSALGSVTLSSSEPQWVEINSVELMNVIRHWQQNPADNRGLVLAGDFYAWERFIELDSVELVVKYAE